MDRSFTLAEAESALADLMPFVDEMIPLRAELTAAKHAMTAGDQTVALADMKGMDARFSELMDSITDTGVDVKGWAPLLLDFPMRIGSRLVLLCWLEGDRELGWWHDATHGFAGRRPLAELPAEG